MTKFILIGFAALASLALTSCDKFNKSEEAVVLLIDTASMLKGRVIHADISIDNAQEAVRILRTWKG